MAKPGVSHTALGAAVCRLIEQYQPDAARLFDDPVVKGLVGTSFRILLQSAWMRNLTVNQTDRIMAGLYGAQVCRTRCIDDAVRAALSQGVVQVVILGAGFDTRPYRLAEMQRAKVFEVDLPAVQADKKEKLRKLLWRLPENVAFIPIDFSRLTNCFSLDILVDR